MLRWTLSFLVLALIAGFFGFSGVATISIGIAKLLFFIFVILFIIAALIGFLQGRSPSI